MEATKEIVADLKVANKITTRIKWVLMIISALTIVGLIAYFIIHEVQTQDQLKQLVVGENKIIQNQTTELAQIKANQVVQAKDNSDQLDEIQALLQQQDDYIKCLAGITSGSCKQPNYVVNNYTITSPTQSTHRK